MDAVAAEQTLHRLESILQSAVDLLEPLALRAEAAKFANGTACFRHRNTGHLVTVDELASVAGEDRKYELIMVTKWDEEQQPSEWTKILPSKSVLKDL